jgi:hypothetical protein
MKNLLKIITLFAIVILTKVDIKASINFENQVNIKNDSTELIPYYGVYNFQENQMVSSVRVHFKDGKFTATDQNGADYPLTRDEKNKDLFTISTLGATVTFTRKENKIAGLTLNLQGQDITAEKEILK